MENIGNINSQEIAMQGLVDHFLKVRGNSDPSSAAQNLHLDEDSLAAFVEGNLNEREAAPVVGHLVECSFCRHITAELVRLDLAFAENEVVNIVETREPSRVSEVLSGLMSKIFGTSDGAVFAHSEEDKEEEEKVQDTEKDS